MFYFWHKQNDTVKTLHTTFLSQINVNTIHGQRLPLIRIQRKKIKRVSICFFYVRRVAKQATETCNCLVNKNMNYTRLIRLHWQFAYMYIHLFFYFVFNWIQFGWKRKKNCIAKYIISSLIGTRVLYNYARQLSVSVNCVAMVKDWHHKLHGKWTRKRNYNE